MRPWTRRRDILLAIAGLVAILAAAAIVTYRASGGAAPRTAPTAPPPPAPVAAPAPTAAPPSLTAGEVIKRLQTLTDADLAGNARGIRPPAPSAPSASAAVGDARGADIAPAPPVSPAAPAARALSVDDVLDTLRAAKVAFNTPERGIVGKPLLVEAKLSTHLSADALRVEIVEAGKVEVAELKVADRMAATLAGGSAFDVSPAGPQEQWISDKQDTAWTWTITPKSVGDQVLLISFDAILTIDGKDDRRTINTLKRHIAVAVGWPDSAQGWFDLVKQTAEDVSWIWATLLIPLGGAVWALIKRRRQAKQPSASA